MSPDKTSAGFMRALTSLLLSVLLAASCAFAVPSKALASDVESEDLKTIVVGYYDSVDPGFMSGASDDARKTGYAYDYMQQLAPYAGWNYEYVYGTRDELLKQMQEGKVDLIAGVYKTPDLEGNVLFSDDDMELEKYDVYFAVNKDKPEILEELNDAVKSSKSTEPKFLGITWEKYFRTNDQFVELTPEEQTYLDSIHSLKFGYPINNLPLSNMGQDGQPEGLVGDLLPVLEDFLDVDIEPIAYDSTNQMSEALSRGELDLAFPIYCDYYVSEETGIFQTDALVSDRVLIAYQGEYRPGLLSRIAVSETALGQKYYIEQHYPDSEIVTFPFRVDAMQGVLDGKADCVIGASSVLSRFLDDHSKEFPGFNVAYLDGSEDFCIGTRAEDSLFPAIMMKAVKQIDTSYISDSMIRNSYSAAEYTLLDVVQRYAVLFVLFWVAVAAIVALALIRYHAQTKKFKEQQAEAHAALEDALAVADKASHAKTAFLSNMSHDIRTPMNGIIGMTAIAAANIDNRERVEDCLAKITSSSKHLLALINEILDVSKIESGKIELSEEHFSISELLDDLLVINRPQAELKNLTFMMRAVDVVHEEVVGDRARLQQVYTNLVSNAIKYTPDGGNVDVTIVERPSGNSKVGCYDLIVKDNGIGISEDYLPHIFEAFTRDERDSISKIQGTGLGMPIAQSITRMMNGDITVESVEGEGSTFTATVFLKLAELQDVSYDSLLDLDILVVDDEEDVCQSTCILLDDLGMNGEYATSGREAVQMVVERNQRSADYFAIILDWVMPEMDGLQTIHEIRRQVPSNIPIIVVSAYDWADIEYEARTAGAMAFVAKPLFKSRLVHMFGEIMGHEDEAERGLGEITGEVSFTGRRALLAEDNELNAEIAIDFLGMTGMEVEHAINGQEAVEMVQQHEPGYYDCVFMDVQMPVMNGIDAAKAIRGMDREDAGTLPIFAMTADAFVDDVKATRDAGMDEHFAKPIDFDQVVKTVAKYFQ